ncbi:AraC family transcriptional regulator [Saccharibacillus sacchari]|uniref:AraC family transcriptional regulator n=1 Tax=Saccharibacillus sacchari TaxID=456493 RepID=A0ACC6PEH3_9BACL
MISTLYEMLGMYRLSDPGMNVPAPLELESPALIVPLGTIKIGCPDTEYRIGNGECLFMQPDGTTRFLDKADSEDFPGVYVIEFERYRLNETSANEVNYRKNHEGLPRQSGVLKFPRYLHQALDELDRRITQTASPSSHPGIGFMLNDLLNRIFVNMGEAEGRYVQDMTIQQLCGYIQQHLHTPLRRSDMAKKTGFNASYFSSLFRKETGWNFGDYVNRLRLDEAKRQLLVTSDSLQEIAARTGFADGSYLSKTFKKYVGITTGAFRSLRSARRVAALQFNGALLAAGIEPVLTTQETADASLLIRDELHETVIADHTKLIERSKEVKPDMIVMPAYYYHFSELVKELEQIAPTVTMEWGKTDKLQEVRQIGAWFDRKREVEQWIERYVLQVEQAREKLKPHLSTGQTVGLYEWNYDQRWLIPHDKVRSAYNLYVALGLSPAKHIRSDVLERNQPLFIDEPDLSRYAADHMFVILPDTLRGETSEQLFLRPIWLELQSKHGCRVYPLAMNEFWMDDGLLLEKQLQILLSALTNKETIQPIDIGQTRP